MGILPMSGEICRQIQAPVPPWYPRPDLNRDLRFRKPLLYPVELRGQVTAKDLDISSAKIVPKFYLGTPRSQRAYGASF